jgi:hypothetical protein
MPKGKSTYNDLTTLQMALVGYELEKQKIDAKIKEIQARLRGRKTTAPSASAEAAKRAPKRVLSRAARKRISIAQKKRWAEHRKKKGQAAKAS